MPWGNLRSGLLADLGFDSAEALGREIHFDRVDLIEQALAGGTPSDDLMAALLRHYLTTPALYFIEPAAADSAA